MGVIMGHGGQVSRFLFLTLSNHQIIDKEQKVESTPVPLPLTPDSVGRPSSLL